LHRGIRTTLFVLLKESTGMDYQIRIAEADDAAAISQVIVAALRTSNARDYPASVIERVERNFSPAAISALMEKRRVFVALIDRQIVGTASLDGRAVRSVFVAPDLQGKGIGRQLMQGIEQTARQTGLTSLAVPASVTAESFYATLGYVAVREVLEGEERTVVMEKVL